LAAAALSGGSLAVAACWQRQLGGGWRPFFDTCVKIFHRCVNIRICEQLLCKKKILPLAHECRQQLKKKKIPQPTSDRPK
jgi:hypothetical protein